MQNWEYFLLSALPEAPLHLGRGRRAPLQPQPPPIPQVPPSPPSIPGFESFPPPLPPPCWCAAPAQDPRQTQRGGGRLHHASPTRGVRSQGKEEEKGKK